MGAATLFVHNVSIFYGFRKIIYEVLKLHWIWNLSEWLTFRADAIHCSSYQ